MTKQTLSAGLEKQSNLFSMLLTKSDGMLVKLMSRVHVITYLMVTGFGYPNYQTQNTPLGPLPSRISTDSQT
jgi:hypothetical protein